ncbi:MAG: hypothetical protein QG671_2349 [Actinomycetota bacterium]|nr:hypothetical protein [Actinomycetota bacterium]
MRGRRAVGRALTLLGAMAIALAGVSSATPASAAAYDPGPVTNVQATSADGQLTISWSPANPGTGYSGTPLTISSYYVRATKAGYSGTVAYCQTPTTSCSLTGLVNGVDHWIEITAYNSYYGSSTVWSAGPWKPCCSIPTPPTAVQASASDGSAVVSWSPPANAALSVGPFTYRVTSEPAGLACDTGAQSCSFTGLANGTSYTFVISAATRFGSSAPVRSSPVTPRGLPGAPSGVVAFTGDRGSATVTWLGPASTGGTPIIKYVATSSPGGANCFSPGTLECSITGLTNGQEYTFTVVAVNVVGTGPASSPSAVARPLAGPGRPRAVKASGARGSATIRWLPPTSTGGLKVTRYVVKSSPEGGSCKTSKLTCRITGLADGTTYVFSVWAYNSKGQGAPAQSRAITTPSAPTPTPTPTPVAPDPGKPTQQVG